MGQQLQARYPGSRPFTEYDKDLFFGRDADVEELRKFINVEKLVVLYARSGLGKSSAINAGLIPMLHKENMHLPITLRFHNYQSYDSEVTPLSIFHRAIQVFFEKYKAENPELFERDYLSKIESKNITLWQYLKTIQAVQNEKKRVLLIFDQFEELFTYPDSSIHEFAEALAELISQVIPRSFRRAFTKKLYLEPDLLTETELNAVDDPLEIKILVSVRSDKLNLLNRLNVEIPNILRNCYELHPLDREQATTAIIRPARKKGEFLSPPFYYSPEALDIVLNYLTQDGQKNDDIEPFQLQILCQHVEENIVIAKDDDFIEPHDLGDLKTIYQSYYDYQISKLPEADRKAARLIIEEGLIFEQEQRRITLYEGQIYSLYKVTKELLDRLVDAHLLRAEPSSLGGYNYELTHDSLVAPILKSKEYRKSMENFLIEQQVAEEKLREAGLQKAKLWRKVLISGGVAVFIIISLTISLFFINQARRALKFQTEANQMATSALRIAKFNPTNALWLTQEGLKIVKDNPALLLVRAENLSQNAFYQNKIQVYDFNVNTMFFSPNGHYIATGGGSRSELVLLDAKGKELWRRKHSEKLTNIFSVAFSPDEKYIVTGGEDGVVILWDLKGNILHKFEQHKESVRAVAFSPDNQKILTAGDDNFAYLWDLESKKVEVTYKNPGLNLGRTITCAVFSPDGSQVALGANDGQVEIWSVRGQKIYNFKYHRYETTSVTFSPAGRYLLTASHDKTFALVDLQSANPNSLENIRILKGYNAPINKAIFSVDGHSILVVGENNSATLWDAEEATLLYTYKGSEASILSADFAPDGKTFITGDAKGKLLFWVTEPMKKQIFSRSGAVKAVVFDKKSAQIYTASQDGRLTQWNQDGNLSKNYLQNADSITTLAIDKDGKQLVTGDSKGNIMFWETAQGASKLMKNLKESIVKVTFHPQKDLLLVLTSKKTLLLDFKGNLIKDLEYKNIKDAVFSEDGQYLFLAYNEEVEVLDLESYEKIRSIGNEGKKITTLAVAHKGTFLVIGYEDSNASAWTFEGERICRFIGHTDAISALAVSEADDYVATGSSDELIKVWDMSGREIQTLNAFSGKVNALQFSPDNQMLLAGYEDNNATLWYLLEAFLQSNNIYKPTEEDMKVILEEAQK